MEETAEWYVEGHTWLLVYVGYFQGVDFNFELWFMDIYYRIKTNIVPCIDQ